MARILIVDDALMMRKSLAGILMKAGHIVEEAVSGEQAVKAYEEYQPDLVTMDITMPGMDGIEALKRIRDFDADAKVVMVSALGQRHKVFAALEAGAKGYVLKPLKEENLLATIQEVTGGQTCRNPLPDFIGKEYETEGSAQIPVNCYAARTGVAVAPFTVETEREQATLRFTLQFTEEDFPFLLTTLQRLFENKPQSLHFDFSIPHSIQQSLCTGFLHAFEVVRERGILVRVSCYTKEYMTYFRNESEAKNIEFKLLKLKSMPNVS